MKLSSAIKIVRKVLAEHGANQPPDLCLTICGEVQSGNTASQKGLIVCVREQTKINTPPHSHRVASEVVSPLILKDNIRPKRRRPILSLRTN